MEYLKEDQIKEAFQKVKNDNLYLNNELLTLKEEVRGMKKELLNVCEILEKLAQNLENKEKRAKEVILIPTPLHPTQKPLKPTTPTHNPTDPTHFTKENKPFSTGNEGVPTDRQTDQQTDRHLENNPKTPIFPSNLIPNPSFKSTSKLTPNPIEDAANILDSLDALKKEIRIKFKQLTDQEVLVFSTLYQLEEEQGQVDYKTLATKLNLTESSIRDYIGRLLKKGIPVEKKKINNKQIQLSISPQLKKVASLSTILQLRDL